MKTGDGKNNPAVSVVGEPGVCGFPCTVRAQKVGSRLVAVEIGSECKQIQKLATCVTEVSLRELFMPFSRNPVYIAAEKSGCHSSCAIPLTVLKAIEVALEMALPREVKVKFINKHESTNQCTD